MKKSLDQDESTNLSREDFLISPESGLMKNKENILRSFEFSDYEEDSESDSNDTFEDSKETLSDTETTATESGDFLTPQNFKTTFARKLQATSTVKPAPSSCPVKRSARSPAGTKAVKKSRAHGDSKIPKKKK